MGSTTCESRCFREDGFDNWHTNDFRDLGHFDLGHTMTLRELKLEEIRHLCEESNQEYEKWKQTHGISPKSEQAVWEWAFSRGVSAALAYLGDRP